MDVAQFSEVHFGASTYYGLGIRCRQAVNVVQTE